MDRLQNGGNAEDVVAELLSKYLVTSTKERVLAYRFYREQRGKYWTTAKLEQHHWEFLYGRVSVGSQLARLRGTRRAKDEEGIVSVREALCKEIHVAEELIPLHNLRVFYRNHETHARLPFLYPEARIFKDTVACKLVEAYRQTYSDDEIRECTLSKCMGSTADEKSFRHDFVANDDSGCIVFPLASANACAVAACAILKCVELYAKQCFTASVVTTEQQRKALKYPEVDFHFWVTYGSWSMCPDCGSYNYNDKYFKETVYQNQSTSSTPDLLSVCRRDVPTDPVVHETGKVGPSSRWWYLPGMYKPAQHCGRCTPQEKQGNFLSRMRQKTAEKAKGAAPIERTGELYRIPREHADFTAKECITWPRYDGNFFRENATNGTSMLDLTPAEHKALQIIVLVCTIKREHFWENAPHQFNWKKVALSRAFFKPAALNEASMPTPRAAAAYRFLMEHNMFYAKYDKMHKDRLRAGESMNYVDPKLNLRAE